jgi:hypothetical protein
MTLSILSTLRRPGVRGRSFVRTPRVLAFSPYAAALAALAAACLPEDGANDDSNPNDGGMAADAAGEPTFRDPDGAASVADARADAGTNATPPRDALPTASVTDATLKNGDELEVFVRTPQRRWIGVYAVAEQASENNGQEAPWDLQVNGLPPSPVRCWTGAIPSEVLFIDDIEILSAASGVIKVPPGVDAVPIRLRRDPSVKGPRRVRIATFDLAAIGDVALDSTHAPTDLAKGCHMQWVEANRPATATIAITPSDKRLVEVDFETQEAAVLKLGGLALARVPARTTRDAFQLALPAGATGPFEVAVAAGVTGHAVGVRPVWQGRIFWSENADLPSTAAGAPTVAVASSPDGGANTLVFTMPEGDVDTVRLSIPPDTYWTFDCPIDAPGPRVEFAFASTANTIDVDGTSVLTAGTHTVTVKRVGTNWQSQSNLATCQLGEVSAP